MSFWRDDFYSTKQARWAQRTAWSGRRIRNPREQGIIAFLFVCAVLITIFALAVQSSEGDVAEPVAAPVESPPFTEQELTDLKLDYNQIVIRAAERVNPSVVSIVGMRIGDENEKGSRRRGSGSGDAYPIGLGSGVIFEIQGKIARIVTNNHVISEVDRVQVALSSGLTKDAKIIGKDHLTDLAVLEIDAIGVERAAEFGDSSKLKAAETVIAIGNALGYSQTTTVGVVSSTHRTVPVSLAQDGNIDWELDVIQTDAAINSGNSGGALVNLEGKVIGINSMKVADFGVEGFGFALPINDVKPVIDTLITEGKLKRPYMGVYLQDVRSFFGDMDVLKLPDDVRDGIILLKAVGPAEKAGLKTNDVIVALDDKGVGTTLELRKYLYANKNIGDEITVTFYRGGSKKKATMMLEEMLEE